MAQSLQAIGVLYRERGELALAWNHTAQSLELSRKLGLKGVEPEALNELGQLYQARGIARIALRYHSEALALARERGSRRVEAEALEHVGLVHQAEDEPEAAAESLTAALAIAGGDDPVVRHVRCALEGDAFCEWELRWKVPRASGEQSTSPRTA